MATGQTVVAIATIWRLRGFAGFARALVGQLHWQALYVRFLVDLAEWEIHGPTPDVEAREGSLAELVRFRKGRDLPGEFYHDRIHGVRRFYLGLIGGEIGHISWIYTDRDRLFHIRLRPGEIALDGAYTFKAFRGRGLLSAVERAALDDAKREGVRAAYTHVHVDNVASIRGVLKTGFVPIGMLSVRRRLGFTRRRFDPELAVGVPGARKLSAGPGGS